MSSKKPYKKIKNALWWIVPLVIIAGITAWLFTLPKKEGADIVSRGGIHIHATLFIKIKGEDIIVPGGIGLGGIQRGTHTHGPDNVLHIEKNGIVRKRDVTVGNFFEIWGKDFSSVSILGNVAGIQGEIKMLVNGEENFEFENYTMKDKDKIEIIYK